MEESLLLDLLLCMLFILDRFSGKLTYPDDLEAFLLPNLLPFFLPLSSFLVFFALRASLSCE